MLGAAPSGSRHFVATLGGSSGVTGFASGTNSTRDMPPTPLPMGGILQLEIPIRCGLDRDADAMTTCANRLTTQRQLP